MTISPASATARTPTAHRPAQVFDLALRRCLPMATQDRFLADAALVAGVGLVSA